jgi:hypothetical protein
MDMPQEITFEVVLADGRKVVVSFLRAEKIAELVNSDDLGPFLRDMIESAGPPIPVGRGRR